MRGNLRHLSIAGLSAFWALASGHGESRADAERPQAGPIRFAQVFTFRVADEAGLAGKRAFIWGARSKPTAGTCDAVYAPAYRLSPTRDHYDPEWLREHHPDWIVYRNDRTSIAWEFGNSRHTPFDFTNQEAAQLKISQLLAAATGHCAVALDNVGAFNAFSNSGHYAGAKGPCAPAARPACGGSWHQDFAGTPAEDARWTAANENYIGRVHGALKAHGIKLVINSSWGSRNLKLADYARLNALADGELKENFPAHGCTTKPGAFLNGRPVDGLFDRALAQNIVAAKRLWIASATLCNRTLAEASQADLAWIVANFLLVMEDPARNLLSITSSDRHARDHGAFVDYSESVNPPIGKALESPPRPGCSPCQRRFANGFVVVNPSSTAAMTYDVPNNGHADQFGQSVKPGQHAIEPASGAVLVEIFQQ